MAKPWWQKHHVFLWAVLAIVLFVIITTGIPEIPKQEVAPIPEPAPPVEQPIAPVQDVPPAQPAGKDELSAFLDTISTQQRGMTSITTNDGVEIRLPIGTDIGAEQSAIGETHFAPKSISTKQGTTTYRQYIRFGERGGDIDSGRVEFTENQFGQVGPYLTFNRGDVMYEYGITFDDGLESAIKDSMVPDYNNRELSLAGRTAIITSSRISTQDGKLRLKLISGGQRSMVKEGSSRTVFGGFSIITVTAQSVSSGPNPKVIFKLNERTTPAMEVGQRITYGDGLSLSVLEILPNEAADGKDTVIFVLGPTALTLEDTYTDEAFSNSVEVNGRTHLGTTVQFRGNVQDDIFRLSSIKFRAVAATDDIYLAPGTTLGENGATGPGNADLGYNLPNVPSAEILFRPGDGSYRLGFFNNEGQKYLIPLLDASGTFRYGDSRRELWWVEGSSDTDYVIEEGDYFVVTSANTYKGITKVFQFDSLDTANSQIVISDLGGNTREFLYSATGVAGQLGSGTIEDGRINARFTVSDGGKLAVDLTSNGAITGNSADIVTMGGGILDLGSTQTIAGNAVDMTLSTPRVKIQDGSSDENVQITFARSGGHILVTIPTQSTIRMRESGDIEQGMTNYGAFFELSGSESRGQQLIIEYPLTQRFADVRVRT